MDCETRHVITIMLENEAGALFRVAGLFSARGYNIDSISVEKTEDETQSHMTIVTYGSDELVKQIINQLDKLVGIIQVTSSVSEICGDKTA